MCTVGGQADESRFQSDINTARGTLSQICCTWSIVFSANCDNMRKTEETVGGTFLGIRAEGLGRLYVRFSSSQTEMLSEEGASALVQENELIWCVQRTANNGQKFYIFNRSKWNFLFPVFRRAKQALWMGRRDWETQFHSCTRSKETKWRVKNRKNQPNQQNQWTLQAMVNELKTKKRLEIRLTPPPHTQHKRENKGGIKACDS